MKPITHYWQSFNLISVSLAPLSLLFCGLVSLRCLLYRLGLLKTVQSPLPVIVVGNIYIGGNGKTPFVIWLVEQLQLAGYTPGVVSRGYGALEEDALEAENHPWPRRVNLQQDIQLFGDEPYLIHQTTHCPVVVDPKRSRAVAALAQETDCDVIISDDGLQHYAMTRLIEINITDAQRLYGNGLCLPAGPLRERMSRLKSVDYIVYNQFRNASATPISAVNDKEFIMAYEFCELKTLAGNNEKSMTLADFKGKIIHAVAGIGEPMNFFQMLEAQGLKVIAHAFADHYSYKAEDLLFDDTHPIIMTEKDAVKCQSFMDDNLLQESLSEIWYLPIKVQLDPQLIGKITQQLKQL
ncbi:tetraacyldisaccharide 4'-kinase [sulfur-oxidizing endosymbiont of Gigantopelta aegis]|uniref:tetraacyldisaccharide 4'-kinase n=1 Tax=sulfur-oxidizing endosymbiont of Gigantopelta aegis TaxID=2794934 RepID=UPI0018DBCAC1|nr:tetraacyldisaccharide 4'-kinase [sulfur-oxidizing endosymbiont of Gigantopelta aegis]